MKSRGTKRILWVVVQQNRLDCWTVQKFQAPGFKRSEGAQRYTLINYQCSIEHTTGGARRLTGEKGRTNHLWALYQPLDYVLSAANRTPPPSRWSSLLINLSTSAAIKIHFQPAITGPRSVLHRGELNYQEQQYRAAQLLSVTAALREAYEEN